MDYDDYASQLITQQLHRFADWPNLNIPDVCAGGYSIYDNEERFIYVGMAGAALDASKIAMKEAAGKSSGLFDRLNSHAGGQRTGDRFNIYIGDLYVLETLTADQIRQIATPATELTFETLIKRFIRENLMYRYLVCPNTTVRGLEKHIQYNGLSGELPTINSRNALKTL